MKLIELYSLASGLKIGKQSLTESFYPLENNRYITLQSGSGMEAKNYPYYAEVVALISAAVSKAGISIVQLGGKDDAQIPGCINLQGHTNLHQSNYILSRSLCHFGNDSWMSHRGGEVGIPLVVLFGSTSVENHGPYHYKSDKSVFIESHRFGRRPTFVAKEAPSTMAVIPPERVAAEIFKILGITDTISRHSIYIGPDYNTQTVELVPDVVIHPDLRIVAPIFIRMDYLFDQKNMANNLTLRKAAIMTNKEIDLTLLGQLKSQILLIRVEADKVSPDWIRGLKRTGIRTDFYSTEKDPVKLAKLRLDYYDACLFDQFQPCVKEDFVRFAGTYLNKPLDPAFNFSSLLFKTNKMVLSDGKVYLSKSHWTAGKHTESSEKNTGNVIDEPAFWEEASHGYFFTE